MPKGQAASGKVNNWSDSTEKRLLLLYGFKPGDWQFIADKMGSTYSASACSQKYGKLKRAIEAEFGASTSNGNANAGGRQSKASNGSKKRSKAMADQDEGDSDEDSVEEPASKQAKKNTKTEETENVIVKADPYLFDVEYENSDLY